MDRRRSEGCVDVQRRSGRHVECSRTWAATFAKERGKDRSLKEWECREGEGMVEA